MDISQWIFPTGVFQRIFAIDNLQCIFRDGYFPMDISKGYIFAMDISQWIYPEDICNG